MKGRHWLAVTLLLISGSADSGHAQSGALILLAHGAYRLPTSNLNEQGDAVGAHWVAGGGVAVQVTSSLALRGSASFGGGSLRSSDPGLNDADISRTVVSFDLQAGIPTTSGWTPYGLVGAGFVRTSPSGGGAQAFTSFSPHLGAGTLYVMDNRLLSLFWEVGGRLYDFEGLGLSSNQFDLELRAGMTYAIPF